MTPVGEPSWSEPLWAAATADHPQPPDRVGADGTREWLDPDGDLHRDDGPAEIWPGGSEFHYRHGELHRANGPAVTLAEGASWYVPLFADGQWTNSLVSGPAEIWYWDGAPHRASADGPAVAAPEFTAYLEHGRVHRTDGPARVYPDGTWVWCCKGLVHRDGGPARRLASDGCMEWWQRGQLHRDDGPAVVYPDGLLAWYKHGTNVGAFKPGPEPPPQLAS